MSNLRALIVNKFISGLKCGEIFREVKHLGINRQFVYRTVKRFCDTGSNENRKKIGRKRSVRTKKNIKIVRERIRRNCERSARKMAEELNLKRESMRKILRDDLKMSAFKKKKIHGLTDAAKEKRRARSKELLSWHAGDDIIFSDEKLFVLEIPHNVQNDRVWAVSIKDVPKYKKHIPRYQNASSVMVWGAISKRGTLPLVFIEKGVKINAKYYLEDVLQKHLMPEAQAMYGEEYYCFQQDGAPAHTAKVVQEWCVANLTDFIAKYEWPPSSPDLNPMDFSIWGYMTQKLKDYQYKTLDEFKTVILRIWDEIPIEVIRAACSDFEVRLKRIIKERGGTIE